MSVSVERTVWCDGADCHAWVQFGEPFSNTAASTRREARDEGWSRDGRADLCPACTRRINEANTRRRRTAPNTTKGTQVTDCRPLVEAARP